MKLFMVSLNSVTISQRNKQILNDINFRVNPGEFVFLIGRTGSGKSSLIKVLYGEIPIDEGNGNIVGFDLKNLNKNKIHLLRRKIGIVFQDFKLLQDMTIFENMNFVLKATGWTNKIKIKERINSVLKLASIDTPQEKYPFELSGGEKQRVAIARALLNDPKLIIADEPTGNLDPETSESIMELLKKLNENGITILMATHDYNMIVKFPGKIFKCEKGEIFEVITKRY
ncbi:MAG: phosphonate ABC transporter ATP-binding protein [Flavobacteriaceae bacterium]|nr:phosphonate ABC transporter ATP-binding protein [Flavobacteriaceae bacterium]